MRKVQTPKSEKVEKPIPPEKPTRINVDREELLKILIRIENALSEVKELKAKIQT